MQDRDDQTSDHISASETLADDPADDPAPSIEEFMQSSWSYCRWMYRAYATAFGRMAVNDGYLTDAPAAGDAPPRLTEEIEEQCVARAEIVYFYSLMPSQMAKQAYTLIPDALFRPLREILPFSEMVFRRIIWLFILMLHDKQPVSDRFRRQVVELWNRYWPDYHGEEVTFQRITDWQCWLVTNEASLLDTFRLWKIRTKLELHSRFF